VNISRHFKRSHGTHSTNYGTPVLRQRLTILQEEQAPISVILRVAKTFKTSRGRMDPNPPASIFPSFEFEHVEENV
jgi:hypothetical protein